MPVEGRCEFCGRTQIEVGRETEHEYNPTEALNRLAEVHEFDHRTGAKSMGA